MKDYTKIIKLDDGHYEMTRTITDILTAEELEKQLLSLQHTKEIAQDSLEVAEIRIKLLEDAKNKGKAEGDTSVVELKPC